MADRPDRIEIRRLKVMTHIGVPDDERQQSQALWITTVMTPTHGFDGLGDAIDHTVDYQAAADHIRALAGSKPRRLIETLAVETADLLLREFPLHHVSVSIEKQILPDTDFVAVHLERRR